MKKKLLALILALVMVLSLAGVAGAATHTVAIGDNLSKLAQQYLGDSAKWNEIYEANKGVISDPNAIYVGQQLTIPDGESSTEPSKPAEPAEKLAVSSITANCESEPYGKAIKSFTFRVNSTASVMDLTADDFMTYHLVYDANETHKPFDAKAKSLSFTKDSITVEVEPFYPDQSFTTAGYWTLTCTANSLLSVDASYADLIWSDPVVEAFEQFTMTYGEGEDAATMVSYLYTPENAGNDPLPIVIFNSGGTGISTTGDVYGANFAVSFAKEASQEKWPCYVLYPQRNSGSTENLIDCIKSYVDGLVAEGKVDGDRIYMTGESAGSSFLTNFIDRHPGWNTAIVWFAGGTDDEGILSKQIGADGEPLTKIMYCPCLGDTTANPLYFYQGYNYLVEQGFVPNSEVVWHCYTAQDFNALCGDNTYWELMQDGEYVTCPITGVKTYMYPDGKLHNNSYPAANDTYIKQWLFNQRKDEFTAERGEDYSAKYKSENNVVDYSVIPEYYTKVAHLTEVPGVPAGQTVDMTVYTNEDESLYYLEFMLGGFLINLHPDMQYAEALVVGHQARVIMDCSGTWWTTDLNNSTLPYIMSIRDSIQWQSFVRDAK